MFKLSFQNIVQPDLSVMLSSEFLSIVILFTFGLSRLLLWLKYLLRLFEIQAEIGNSSLSNRPPTFIPSILLLIRRYCMNTGELYGQNT